MIFNGEEVEFPAVMQVSFNKVIETLEEQAKSEDLAIANYSKELLKEVSQYPELKTGIKDYKNLKKYESSIKKITKPLFPSALSTNEIKALTPPFYFEPILTSERFGNIIKDSGEEQFEFTMKDIDADTFYLYCCYFIMGSYFGFLVPGGGPIIVEIPNKEQNLVRSYKMLINADMSEFEPTNKAIMITKDDYEELIDNIRDIDLWKRKFPPNSWIMSGINMVSLVDVTLDQAINTITSNLLVKSDDSFQQIQHGIRRLLNNSQLEIGVLSYEDGHLIPLANGDVNSVLLQKGGALDCQSGMCDYTYSQLLHKKEPLVIPDVEKYHERAQGGLSGLLATSKYKSYVIIPMIHEDELLGFMEAGATERYVINQGTLSVLEGVLPIIAMAKKRFMTEAQNMVEAIIQQECTTIHPSVKWKFEEEAERFINAQMQGAEPVFKDIVLESLYPLYGQLDIKGSSVRRNEAVSADLIKQLNGASKVLKAALKIDQMPFYEEIIYRLDSFKKDLKKGLSAGSEHKILSFLKKEVYPVFDHLKAKDESLLSLVEGYTSMLDQNLYTVYEERKKYDTSVNLINQRLASFLDDKQEAAQKVFPHYFERYKTDGVEFNMYIGQSISKNHVFDKMYLKNLRLWQLIVMCEMENEYKKIKSQLHTDIELASLILVYNTSLSVHFRMDEKQFDVEGAYNARYEIIKKRVDKAHIKGTKERITQPGKIAIIYSQESDAQEYREYIDYLNAKGYLTKGCEDLALEDLQGVSGLRALRVRVDYTGELTVDELIEAIEEGVSN